MSDNIFVATFEDCKTMFSVVYDPINKNSRPWFKYSILPIIVGVLWILACLCNILVCILECIHHPIDTFDCIFKPIGKFIYWIFYKEPERKNENGQE